jgi:hypothetical protein
MRIGGGNRCTGRKPAPVPLYPPEIPHDLTRARTRTAEVGNRRLDAFAMARPCERTLTPREWHRIITRRPQLQNI